MRSRQTAGRARADRQKASHGQGGTNTQQPIHPRLLPQGHPVRLGLYLGLSAAVVLSLTINLIVCCKYCQRSRKNSVPQTKETCNNVAEVDDAAAAELEWYTEIPLTDMAQARESTGGNSGGGSGAAAFVDDVYDVAVERKPGFPVVVGSIYSKLSHDQ
ncbi:uncharacterized protein LOC124265120 [Haliotis rubra]|uniref:uncharacterized protein LOC124265120 n=1 Tax=Haliotis rubra TaxID=36100 RepID=UPI001EE5FEC4|nr:uncharacterized protein LOC124265120 [Haliotis rubra]